MIFRRARAEESDQIAELWLRSRRTSVPAIPPAAHSDDEVTGWFREVVVPHREVWLAYADDDEIVALLVLNGEWLDQLYVAPERVGRGIGSQLLSVAKAAHPDGLQLWAFESNVGARRFYERHGFTAEARTDGDNEERAPDVHYAWRGADRCRISESAGAATSSDNCSTARSLTARFSRRRRRVTRR